MMQQLGLSLRHQDRFEEARLEYRRAIKILRNLEEHAPLSPNYEGILLNDTGVAWKVEGHLDEAETYFRQSLDTRNKAAEKYPNDIDQLAIRNRLGTFAIAMSANWIFSRRPGF